MWPRQKMVMERAEDIEPTGTVLCQEKARIA